jgi:GNAT superfamily N-acetyltransferase
MLEERLKAGLVERIDRFHARELDCEVELLRQAGVHLLPSERRARPGWGGYTVPIFAMSTPVGGIVSFRPDLQQPIVAELGGLDAGRPLEAGAFDRLRRIVRRGVPYAYSLSGFVLYADRESFRPFGSQAELLPRDDHRGLDLRRRFDGEVFVVKGARGEIASWAALKLKSDDVWEMAVVTEPAYRGRGYAKQVVSAATAYTLDQGRLALYVHDRTNRHSARVCRSLGYVEYAEEYFCEY